MAVFTCELCFAILKKQQIDKHCVGKCKNAWAFTCVECGKTMEGYDYKEHNECMTEVQKYQGQFLEKKRNEKANKKVEEKKVEAAKEVSDDDDSSEDEKCPHLGDDKTFTGWKKTALSILNTKGKAMKKKKLIKAVWKVYTKSKTFKELSLDQQQADYKSIIDVVMKIIEKEKKKFDIAGDSEDKSCKIRAR